MRLDHFEALAPVCPRCLHAGHAAHLIIAERCEMRAGVLWHGMLHCSDNSCWAEYPVIDAVPVLVPDVPAFLKNAEAQILARQDLPASLTGLLGDALGQGGTFDATRQHLGLYATSHYSDWTASVQPAPLAAILDRGFELLGPDAGDRPALDIGSSVGRGTLAVAATGRRALGIDMNFSMLRLAQRLLLEGRVSYDRRRIGLVFDPVEIVLPEELDPEGADFWAADAMALPFLDASFGMALAINVVDCIAGPTNMLHEAARVVAPGAPMLVTTPYDWAETATERAAWMGGHSQRGPHQGRGEDVLLATLAQAGFEVTAEDRDVPWLLDLHERATMHYSLHMAACRRMSASE